MVFRVFPHNHLLKVGIGYGILAQDLPQLLDLLFKLRVSFTGVLISLLLSL